MALLATVPQELIDRWVQISEHYIALVELAAVVMAFEWSPGLFHQRDFVWFEDNAVVLGGLVKGDSRHPEIEAGVSCIHLWQAHLKSRGWFEYIQSDSKWADSPSRKLHQCPWLRKHGFKLVDVTIPMWPWVVPVDQRAMHINQMVIG